jgi:flavodoxin I
VGGRRIGIFYGSTSYGTRTAAEMIRAEIGADRADLRDVHEAMAADIEPYDRIVFGTSTWGVGGLQHDWDRFIHELPKADFAGKKVALFALGDQLVWSETFVNSMGIIYDTLVAAGAEIVGSWPTDGYEFDASRAVRDGRFVGLALDKMNQKDLQSERIAGWVAQVLQEFDE